MTPSSFALPASLAYISIRMLNVGALSAGGMWEIWFSRRMPKAVIWFGTSILIGDGVLRK
jgi:hypothetical protein